MKPLLLLVVMIFSQTARADLLLNAMLGLYPYEREPVKPVETYSYDDSAGVDSEYGNNSEYDTYEGYGEVFEFEDYHLCQYCDTEIIYDGQVVEEEWDY